MPSALPATSFTPRAMPSALPATSFTPRAMTPALPATSPTRSAMTPALSATSPTRSAMPSARRAKPVPNSRSPAAAPRMSFHWSSSNRMVIERFRVSDGAPATISSVFAMVSRAFAARSLAAGLEGAVGRWTSTIRAAAMTVRPAPVNNSARPPGPPGCRSQPFAPPRR